MLKLNSDSFSHMVLRTASAGQQKQPGRPFEATVYERPDLKPVKVRLQSFIYALVDMMTAMELILLFMLSMC